MGAAREDRDESRTGWRNGFIGMLMFAGSLPATRIAVETLDPVFVTLARSALAGSVALVVLLLLPQRQPTRSETMSLLVVAAGCVIAFPLLTSLALRQMTSADALVFVGLIPLATAIWAQVRGDRRPHPAFWLFAVVGTAITVGFALGHGARMQSGPAAMMLAAVVACGLGYAEGARAARRLGGWQVVSWALVMSLPLTLPLADFLQPDDWSGVTAASLAGLAYVSAFSAFIGFVFWYDGLARGGTTAVGQLQLAQPFFGLIVAGVLLHETVGWSSLAMLAATIACAAGARHYARRRPAPSTAEACA